MFVDPRHVNAIQQLDTRMTQVILDTLKLFEEDRQQIRALTQRVEQLEAQRVQPVYLSPLRSE